MIAGAGAVLHHEQRISGGGVKDAFYAIDKLVQDGLKSGPSVARRVKNNAECASALRRLHVVCERLDAAFHERLVLGAERAQVDAVEHRRPHAGGL